MYQQLFILFALIFTGYALAKAGILNEAVTLGINKMILFFAFPCLIAYKLGTMEVSVQMAKDFVIVNVLGAVSFVLFTIIAHLYYRVRGLTDKVSAPMMLCSCMPNNGFLGYPVTLVFLGNPGLILMIAHGAIVFNVYTYSYAITYLRNSALKDKPKLTKGRVLTMVLQVALNPNIIGIEVGLIIFAAGISLDNVAGDYLSMIADMASPLAMIYTGAMLANAVLTLVAAMGVIDLCVRVFVGLSARAEGRGERRNPFYLVVAAVAAIVNAMTLIVTVMGASSAVTIPYVLVSGAIEATAFAALLMVIYSSIRLRHMGKTTE